VPFLLVCLASVGTFTNYMMLNPVLPLQVTRLGETAAFVGLTIAAFSGTSVLARPFVGSAVDRLGSGIVFAFGALLLAVSSLAYVVPSLVALVVARMAHGIGWAAVNTAGTTLAAAVAPDSRRGEAMGWLSFAKAIAAAAAPAAGLTLLAVIGFELTFVVAAGVAATAVVAAAPLIRGSRPAASARRSYVTLDRSSLIPASILALVYAGNPLVQSFIILLVADRAIEGVAGYFLASGLMLVAVQPLARITDRVGRGPNIGLGLAAIAAGLLFILVASDLPTLVVGGVLWSAGAGLVEPAATALALDLAPPDRRGAAMATYTAAFQVGNAGGALAWGFVIAVFGFEAAIAGAITCVAVALVVLRASWNRVRAARTGTADQRGPSPIAPG
jgi:MFS family permease